MVSDSAVRVGWQRSENVEVLERIVLGRNYYLVSPDEQWTIVYNSGTSMFQLVSGEETKLARNTLSGLLMSMQTNASLPSPLTSGVNHLSHWWMTV